MNKQMRFAAALPLIGLNAAWVVFMFAAWAEHKENLVLNFDQPEHKASTYLYLAAIAVFSIVASIAHRLADTQDASGSTPDKAAHAVLRFASLAVIVGLVAGAIFAISTFLNSFGSSYPEQHVTLGGRLLGVYLPIILATALVVFVLLRVTVYRKSAPSAKDENGKRNPQQRAMVLGFTLPIVATALATIIGLAFWDFQGQNLDNWVWVVVMAIVAAGLIFGTRFAVSARAAKPEQVRPRMTGAAAAGAVTLNYVLAVVFGAVVTVMSFSIGASSFSIIGSYPQPGTNQNWFADLLLPAYVMLLLVTIAVFFTLVSRHEINAAKEK
jgi:amino acid permease